MTFNRRTFLRAAGVSLALPWLDALAPSRAPAAAAPPRRMVCICTPLGLHPPYFFPQKAGKDYALTPVPGGRSRTSATTSRSSPGCRIRRSGSSHDSIYSFLTAAPHPERRAGFRNSISLDQFAAEHIGGADALPQPGPVVRGLQPVLDAQRRARAVGLLAVERVRQAVPRRPARRGRRPRRGGCATARASSTRSREQAKQMQPDLGAGDRDKLDEYFTSVRELEQRLAQAEEWSKKPKPKVDAKPPQNITNPADLDRQDPAHVRPDPPGPADRFDPARHAAAARHQPRAADPGRDRWAITTCRTTARTRTRSSSSRRSSWRR